MFLSNHICETKGTQRKCVTPFRWFCCDGTTPTKEVASQIKIPFKNGYDLSMQLERWYSWNLRSDAFVGEKMGQSMFRDLSYLLD